MSPEGLELFMSVIASLLASAARDLRDVDAFHAILSEHLRMELDETRLDLPQNEQEILEEAIDTLVALARSRFDRPLEPSS